MADIFISHSSKDSAIAEIVCAQLEQKGFTCWIAPRNIIPGSEWAASISKAIFDASAVLLIYSENSAQSTQVPKELSLAESRRIFVIPYKIDNAELTGSFEYYLTGSHWIVADPANNDYKIEELSAIVAGIMQSANKNVVNNTYIDNLTINNPAPQPNPVPAPAPAVTTPAPEAAPAYTAAPQPAPAPVYTAVPQPTTTKKSAAKKIIAIVAACAVVVIGGIVAGIVLTSGGNNAVHVSETDEDEDWEEDEDEEETTAERVRAVNTTAKAIKNSLDAVLTNLEVKGNGMPRYDNVSCVVTFEVNNGSWNVKLSNPGCFKDLSGSDAVAYFKEELEYILSDLNNAYAVAYLIDGRCTVVAARTDSSDKIILGADCPDIADDGSWQMDGFAWDKKNAGVSVRGFVVGTSPLAE